MTVLISLVVALAPCYGTGTLDVYVAVVSAYMQDSGTRSLFDNRVFKMAMEEIKRWKGLGKNKKPGVEAKFFALIVPMERPAGFSGYCAQALALLVIGWQMFRRAQAGLRRQPECNKVQGEPTRCDYCPPAFPSVHIKGVQTFCYTEG